MRSANVKGVVTVHCDSYSCTESHEVFARLDEVPGWLSMLTLTEPRTTLDYCPVHTVDLVELLQDKLLLARASPLLTREHASE